MIVTQSREHALRYWQRLNEYITEKGYAVTLPPTFIQRERDSEFEFCPIGRVGQRGLVMTQRNLHSLSR